MAKYELENHEVEQLKNLVQVAEQDMAKLIAEKAEGRTVADMLEYLENVQLALVECLTLLDAEPLEIENI
jgi:hypothetical protein